MKYTENTRLADILADHPWLSEELPKKAEFRFVVRALNSYGVKGAPVFSDWRRAGA